MLNIMFNRHYYILMRNFYDVINNRNDNYVMIIDNAALTRIYAAIIS